MTNQKNIILVKRKTWKLTEHYNTFYNQYAIFDALMNYITTKLRSHVAFNLAQSYVQKTVIYGRQTY